MRFFLSIIKLELIKQSILKKKAEKPFATFIVSFNQKWTTYTRPSKGSKRVRW